MSDKPGMFSTVRKLLITSTSAAVFGLLLLGGAVFWAEKIWSWVH